MNIDQFINFYMSKPSLFDDCHDVIAMPEMQDYLTVAKYILACKTNNLPVYVRFTDGPRKDSIVKINHTYFRKNTRVGLKTSDQFISEPLLSKHKNFYFKAYTSAKWMVETTYQFDIIFGRGLANNEVNPVVSYDDGKTHSINYSDYERMEILPGYVGPTHYSYVKKAKVDNPVEPTIAHVPIDLWGNELCEGDLFIYARRDELVVAKLTKVTKHGFIHGETVMDNKPVMLRGETSIYHTLRGEKNPVLMKIDPDNTMQNKLLIEKLKN